jgi:hypothetical protein
LLTLIATNEYGKTNTIVFQEVSFYSEYISYDRAFANAPPLSFDLELLLASPHENDAVDAILLCSYNLPEKSVAQLLIPFFLIFFGSTLLSTFIIFYFTLKDFFIYKQKSSSLL